MGAAMARKRAKVAKPPRPIELVTEGGVRVARHGDDRGPPERWQHAAYVDDSSVKGAPTVRRVLDVAPLDHYRRRDLITEAQWKAGDRLRAVWRLAGIEPRVTANLLGTGGGAVDMSDARASNIARYVAAMRAVGIVLSPVIVHVVCLEGTAGEWAELRGRRGTNAKVEGLTTLRLALETLALHYGLTGGRT